MTNVREYVHYLSGKQLQCLITFNFPCLASPHSRNRDLALENLLYRRCEDIYYSSCYTVFSWGFLGSTVFWKNNLLKNYG